VELIFCKRNVFAIKLQIEAYRHAHSGKETTNLPQQLPVQNVYRTSQVLTNYPTGVLAQTVILIIWGGYQSMLLSAISRIVNASFIRRFQNLSISDSSQQAFSAAQSGGSAGADISNALRVGARTYAGSVQKLNAVSTTLMLSQSTLGKLIKTTEKLMDHALKATDPSTSSQGRAKLDRQFKKLSNKFQKIVDNARIGDRKFLTVDGIKELFATAGLDSGQSQLISDLFKKFIIPDSEDSLASEKMTAEDAPYIPELAFMIGSRPRTGWTTEQVSQNDPWAAEPSWGQAGFISTTTTIYQSSNTAAGTDTLHVASTEGTAAQSITADNLDLMAIQDRTGYSVIQSTADLLNGQNTGGLNQLFLVDNSGRVVHQLTDTTDSDRDNYYSVSLAADNRTVAIAGANPHQDNRSAVYTLTVDQYGSAPGGTIGTFISTGGITSDSTVSLDADGSTLAYTTETGRGDRVYLRSTAADSTDDMTLEAYEILDYGFADSDTLFIARDTDRSGSADSVYSYTKDSGQLGDAIISGIEIDQFTTLEKGTNSNAFFAYSSVDETDQTGVHLIKDDGMTITSVTSEGRFDIVTNLSLAFNPDGLVDIGAHGRLASISGDPDIEMYRSRASVERARRFSGNIPIPEEIFNGLLSLTSPPQAYHMLNHLQSMHDQIKQNLKAVNQALDTLQANIDLVRHTGLAMLELADQISSDTEAEDVARKLARMIQKSAGRSLLHAANLESLAAAALLQEDSNFASQSKDRISLNSTSGTQVSVTTI
jgi:hypothetical protein